MGNRTKYRSKWRFCVVDAVEQFCWSELAKLVGVVAKVIGSRSIDLSRRSKATYVSDLRFQKIMSPPYLPRPSVHTIVCSLTLRVRD